MAPDATPEARWRAFFDGPAAEAVRTLVGTYPDERSLYVDVVDLHQFDPAFVEALFARPDAVLRQGAEVLRSADGNLERANVRLRNLPSQLGLRYLRARHVGSLVTVEGIVKSVGPVGATVREGVYDCPACGATQRVHPRGVEPSDSVRCGECDSSAPLVLDRERSTFVDLQRVELSEPEGATNWAGAPRQIDVYLDDDLVDGVDVPDSLLVTGTVRLAQYGESNRYDFYLDALAVEEQVANQPTDDVDVPERLKESIRSRWEFAVADDGD